MNSAFQKGQQRRCKSCSKSPSNFRTRALCRSRLCAAVPRPNRKGGVSPKADARKSIGISMTCVSYSRFQPATLRLIATLRLFFSVSAGLRRILARSSTFGLSPFGALSLIASLCPCCGSLWWFRAGLDYFPSTKNESRCRHSENVIANNRHRTVYRIRIGTSCRHHRSQREQKVARYRAARDVVELRQNKRLISCWAH